MPSPKSTESPAQAVAHAESLYRNLSDSIDRVVTTIDEYTSATLTQAAATSTLPLAASQAALAKRIHISLQCASQRACDAALPAARDAASASLLLENARYEARALRRQLAECETVPTPHLDALLPTLPSNDNPSQILSCELDRRRALSARVDKLRAQRDASMKRTLLLEEALKSLPGRVARAARDVPSLRAYVSAQCAAACNDADVAAVTMLPAEVGFDAEWSELPAPLYALVHQALAFRSANAVPGIDINVHVAKCACNTRSTGTDRLSAALHGTDERVIDLQVALKCDEKDNSTNNNKNSFTVKLRFSHHPKLGIVSIQAMNDNVSISELSLYEDDKGTESPNPANAHLLDGKFRFDSSSGRRTYRWANALCALHFLPTTDAIGTHVRFVDVITRLKQRLQRLRSLKEQADEIADGRKRMRDEKVQIAHFEKLHDMAKKELRVRVRDTALVYRVSLKAKAGADNVCGVFVVNVIEENSTPVLHMENCGGLSGRLSDIERNVNNTDGKGTLRARVEALVGCVEALVVDAESSSRSRDTRRKVHDRERVADYSDV